MQFEMKNTPKVSKPKLQLKSLQDIQLPKFLNKNYKFEESGQSYSEILLDNGSKEYGNYNTNISAISKSFMSKDSKYVSINNSIFAPTSVSLLQVKIDKARANDLPFYFNQYNEKISFQNQKSYLKLCNCCPSEDCTCFLAKAINCIVTANNENANPTSLYSQTFNVNNPNSIRSPKIIPNHFNKINKNEKSFINYDNYRQPSTYFDIKDGMLLRKNSLYLDRACLIGVLKLLLTSVKTQHFEKQLSSK